MAQGEFTKQEAEATRVAVQEMWEALTRGKKFDFVGRLNSIFLFLDAAKRRAPGEQKDVNQAEE